MLSSHNKVEANDQWILPFVGLNSGEHADKDHDHANLSCLFTVRCRHTYMYSNARS